MRALVPGMFSGMNMEKWPGHRRHLYALNDCGMSIHGPNYLHVH